MRLFATIFTIFSYIISIMSTKKNKKTNNNKKKPMKRKFLKSKILYLFLFTIILNALSWVIPGFSDKYTQYVFPLWVNSYGRVTSLVNFSVGEFLIIAGLLWLVMILFSKNIRRLTPGLLSIIFLIMTLNCFINYHCTPIEKTFKNEKEFTIDELAELRDAIVTKCNELSEEVSRNDDGTLFYDEELMNKEAKESMQALGGRFPKLSGFYVTPKKLLFSKFISQQYMQGYYFPFSMEANYNSIMYVTNKPFTMCHELAHTKSYIFEDEANFLAYLACVGSDDTFFKYSGYLGVLNYVNNAFYLNVSKEEYNSHVKISDKVKMDNIFLTKDSWKKVEETAVIDTGTVKKAADTFVDTTLKVNGVNDGKASYDRVVELLLLEYYSR